MHLQARGTAVSPSAVVDHRAQAVARVERVDGLRRLADAVEAVGDEVVHGDLALHHLVGQHRDRVARLPAAKRGAKAAAAGDELEGARRNLLARRGNTDEAALAPAAVRRLESGAHHLLAET